MHHGEEIVIAKWIMDMANPDQILVSRWTAELVASFDRKYIFRQMGEHTVKHGVDLSSFTFKDEEGNLIGNDKAVVCDCHSQREEGLSTFLKILTAPTMKYNGIKDNLDTDYYLYKGRGKGIDPIGNPHRGEPTESELTPGNVLFFNFSTVPVSVDAYLIDFEADTVTLISVPKMGKNKFRLGHRHLSIYNLQVYAVFPKGLEVVYNKYVRIREGRKKHHYYRREQELRIETVTASEKDYNNKPLYVFDDDEDTFWSGGEGSWIQADLGQARVVYGFEISWLKGSSEESGNINHFEAALSNNGTKPGRFVRLVSTGNSVELYYIDDPEPIEARYLRLRFGNNQENNRFNIVSLKILGNNRLKRKRAQ